MSYKKKIKSYTKSNLIKRTIRDTNNKNHEVFEMNYEFNYNGHKQGILINYRQSSYLEILKYNSTYSYSYTAYNILSHLSISGDC